ncbi:MULTISPECIES: imelysin family protein [Pseudomonas fluorescens group]|uniref:Insulin-cleaving metalloproteinase outer membrane protein n=2 Tax=Pseudomonas fluorescens group TaxID=136843 RepID=A0A0R2YWL6_9PSED|nr:MULTISPECIES: imelysin family protein [Pseudomonas fluorescens group]AZE57153.1 Iron-regulated protein A precursor [Pseudomonas synxantha]AZE68858.1 Iron-regulated protein A precursor [Pseudomonas synxantha]KRP43217.1 peptidase [Pseudomonas libanensis]KRP52992.1 peptidase [Pseudomonas synxantha]MBI6565797.1 peptidase [Pseudomonas synxantha]
MIRMPLATASLLAIAISLAGCGEGKDKAAAPQAPAAASATAPAAAPAGQVDEAAAKAVVAHYADMVFAVYSDAESTAKTLQTAVDTFLANPNDETLKAARTAWIAARVPYLQSEVFRFGNTIIDDWEGQVNAWPLDEGLIDYVDKSYEHALGNPGANANIIANNEIQVGEDKVDVKDITPEKLASLNELGGSEANVATGYHAIEFLLWGQDLNGTGPGAGNRPASDYLTGDGATGGHNERRRTYLRAVTQLLVSDLEEMVGNWKPNVEDNYRATLESEPATDGLRKMLFGMGSLSLGELAGERMKVSLEANSPEDEQDCFSDNTHYSHFYDAKGIRNVYLGEYTRVDGTKMSGASLSSLVAKADPAADSALKADLAATEAKIQVMVDHAEKGEHYDQLIAAGNDAGNQIVRDAIAALVKQTGSIEAAAGKLGISDLNPDSADHEF